MPGRRNNGGGDYRNAAADDEKDSHKRHRATCAALVVAAVALLLGGVALGLSIANTVHNANQVTPALPSDLLLLRQQLLDVLMNTSSYTETTLQQGTFTWEFKNEVVNQNVFPAAPYLLKNIQLGPLNFTVLSLAPPSAPFVGTDPAFALGGGAVREFQLRSFTPPIIGFSSNLNILYPFSQPNTDRMLFSPPCPGVCLEGTTLFSDYDSYNSLGIISAQQPGPHNTILYGVLANVPLGTSFTLSSPWEIIVPTY